MRQWRLGLLFLSVCLLVKPQAAPVDSENADTTEASLAPPIHLVDELIRAENPTWHHRTHSPERVFLFDGADAVGPGETFYSPPNWMRRLIWSGPLDPGQEWLALSDANLADTSRGMVRIEGSGEPNEITQVPEGELKWKLLPELKLRAVLEQTGSASDELFSHRLGMLKPGTHAQELAWTGNRLPVRSLALGSMSFHQRTGTLHAIYAEGTRWSLSPITGRSFPWDIRLTRLAAEFDEGSGLYLDLAQWETPQEVRENLGEGSSSEMGVRLRGGGDGWHWQMQWAFERRTLVASKDTTTLGTFQSLDDERFPLYIKAQRRFEFEKVPEWEWNTDGVANSRSGLISLEMNSSLRRKAGKHHPQLGTSLFMTYRTRGTTVAEEMAFDSLQGDWKVVGMVTPNHGRGGAVSAQYLYQKAKWEANAISRFAAEWERPVFEGAWIPSTTTDGHPTRIGMYRASQHVLFNTTTTLQASTTVLPHARFTSFVGWRHFVGAESGELEYEPAPFWMGGQGVVDLPFGLAACLGSQWVATKWVRQWGSEPLRIRPHLETQLGIRQVFLHQRMEASLQWLHALGENVLEHPSGGTVESRVRLGLKARW